MGAVYLARDERLDFGSENGTDYLVMERVNGPTLDVVARRGPQRRRPADHPTPSQQACCWNLPRRLARATSCEVTCPSSHGFNRGPRRAHADPTLCLPGVIVALNGRSPTAMLAFISRRSEPRVSSCQSDGRPDPRQLLDAVDGAPGSEPHEDANPAPAAKGGQGPGGKSDHDEAPLAPTRLECRRGTSDRSGGLMTDAGQGSPVAVSGRV